MARADAAADKLSSPFPLDPHQGYDSCLKFIGCACEIPGQHTKAETYFRKAPSARPQAGLALADRKRVAKNEK